MPAPYWPQQVLFHDHIDASFSLLSILPQLHRMSGKPFPFNDRMDLREQVKRWFFSGRDIVERFSVTTGVMQKPETISLVAETYTKVRARQGFRYCEFTVAPQYHVFGGLTEKEVIEALIAGIKRGEAEYPEIEVNILFSVGREVPPGEAVRLINVAGECDRGYVVGVGLVCDEAAHPPEKHIAMFRRAKELGFKTTCHAGEWVSPKPDFERDLPGLIKNIRTAVFDLEVDRIGHAIGLPYDSAMKAVVDRQIGIEGCPGSNYSLGLIPNTRRLKIREMLNVGILYSLNPDDDLYLPTLDETFQLCDDEYSFTEDEKTALKLNGWKTKFGNRKNQNYPEG